MREKRKIWMTLLAFVLVLVAGALQMHRAFPINGVRPDLLLIALLVSSFFIEDIAVFGLLALLASVSIRFTTGWSPEALALIIIGLIAFLMKSKLVWPGIYGSAVLIGLGTILMYALSAPSFLLHGAGVIAGELVYNMVLGFIMYEALDWLTKRSSRI